jgi:hypothetical protein
MFDVIFENLDAMIHKLEKQVAANINLQPIDDSINILQSIKRLQNARWTIQRVLVDEGAVKRCLKGEMEGSEGLIVSVSKNGTH